MEVKEINIAEDVDVVQKHKDLLNINLDNLTNKQKRILYNKYEDAIQKIRNSKFYSYTNYTYDEYKQIIAKLIFKRDVCNKKNNIFKDFLIRIKKY